MKRITVIFMVIIITIGIAFQWLVSTNSGLIFIVRNVVSILPGTLTVQSIEGTLSEVISIRQLAYHSPGMTVSVDQAKLDIKPSRIWVGKLAIESATFGEVNLQLNGVADTKTNTSNKGRNDITTTGETDLSLPVKIDISQLLANVIHIQQGKTPPLKFIQIQARNLTIDRNIYSEILTFEWNHNRISTHGTFPFDKNVRMDLDTTFELNLQGLTHSVAGNLTTQGTLEQFKFSGQLSTPDKLSYSGELRSVLDNPTWDITLSAAQLNTSNWKDGESLELKNFSTRSTGDINNFTTQGSGQFRMQAVGKSNQFWNCNFSVNKIQKQWEIKHINVTGANHNSYITASGDIYTDFDFDQNTPFSINGKWTTLRYPYTDDPIIQSNNGNLNVRGTLQNYQLSSELDLETSGHYFKQVNLSGNGTSTDFHADTLSGSYLAGMWNGDAKVEWKHDWQWQAKLHADGVDLGLLIPGWSSDLSGTLTHEGSIVEDKLIIDVNTKRIHGRIHKRDVIASGSIHYANQTLAANKIDIKSDGASLTGSAKLNFDDQATFPVQEAKWSINVDELSTYYAEMAGKLRSSGHFIGPLEKPKVSATINAQGLKYHNVGINSMSGSIKLYPDILKKSSTSIKLTGMQLYNQTFDSITLESVGLPSDHELTLHATLPDDMSFTLQANAHLKDTEWQSEIIKSSFNTQSTHWRLNRPSQLLIKKDNIALFDTCFTEQKAQNSTCINFNYKSPDDVESQIKLIDISLAYAHNYLPEQIKSISGAVSGNLSMNIKGEQIEIKGALKSQQGTIESFIDKKETNSFDYSNLQLNVFTHDNNVHIDAMTRIANTGHIKTAIQLPSHIVFQTSKSNAIHGSIDIQLDSLDIIGVIVPDIEQAKGTWQSHLDISGTLGKPLIQGHSAIHMSSALIPRAGLELKEVKLDTQAYANHNLEITGTAISGDGDLAIDGAIQDYQSDKIVGNLHIKGNNFKILKLPESNVSISPDLNFTLKENLINLDGTMTINQADINIFSPTSRITPSSDVVIVNQKPEKNIFNQLALSGDVRVNLEDKVWLRGYGFQGRLKGSILVHERPNELTNATGEFQILEGKYSAYNQELTIETGSLTFAGNPVDNPNVRIRAVRETSNEIIVGLTVSGPAQSPIIQLFSEPAMDEAEILAYIILGYPIKQATQQDGSILANAAATIGLAKGEKLVKKIANKFGIDEVKLQSSNTTQEASLVLGKYLSPQLYLRYAYGIGKAVNTLQLQYQITDKWMIKTESGQTQSTDILFSIEK